MIAGLFIGGLMPFLFASLAMQAVGRVGGEVVTEVRRQFRENPGIMEGTSRPEYGRAIDIVTNSAIKAMLLAGIDSDPLPGDRGHHQRAHARRPADRNDRDRAVPRDRDDVRRRGVGQREEADRGRRLRRQGIRGSRRSVTGDTVGDPYKDTAGPAINPMIKIANIVAILIIPLIVSIHG